jgi:hypothetical protein
MRTVRTLGYAEARSFEWDQGDSLWPRSRSNTGLRSGTEMGASGGGWHPRAENWDGQL